MLLALLACSTEPADLTSTPAPGPKPTEPKPAVPKPGEALLVVPVPTDAPSDLPTDVPEPTDAPERPKWEPRQPYVSKISAPDWPDPSIHPDQCGDLSDGGPLSSDGCVTADLECGDRIVGHTMGGVERYDSRFYEKKMCWPLMIDHDGGDERIYRLHMPPGEWRAWVTLYTPCADLSLAAIKHQGRTCPTIDHPIRVCEMAPKPDLMTERLELTTQTRPGSDPTWYIVVEGPKDEEGMFELVVQCHPGLGGTVPKP